MKKVKYFQEKIWTICFLVFAGCASVLFIQAVPQNDAYHHFADCRTIAGVENFWNVFSNIPFLLIGVYGIFYLINNRKKIIEPLFLNYILFFLGIILIGLGSSYYHLSPCNDTLIWDRMPMTISFMAFFSIIIGENINAKIGKRFLFPLIIIGIGSVLYWYYTESTGNGDLRFYFIVQFLPMILTPIILFLFKPIKKHSLFIWLVIIMYTIAKVTEVCDFEIFAFLKYISGHSIKHFFAALGSACLLMHLYKNNR